MYISINISSNNEVGNLFITGIASEELTGLKNINYIVRTIKVVNINRYEYVPLDIFYFDTIKLIVKDILKLYQNKKYTLIIKHSNCVIVNNYFKNKISKNIKEIKVIDNDDIYFLTKISKKICETYKKESTDIIKSNLNNGLNFPDLILNDLINDDWSTFFEMNIEHILKNKNKYNNIFYIKLLDKYKNKTEEISKFSTDDEYIEDDYVEELYYEDNE